jgi:hypothetical protein
MIGEMKHPAAYGKICIGCKSLSIIVDPTKFKCPYTNSRSLLITKCPCCECLIKPICGLPCEDFFYNMKHYSKQVLPFWLAYFDIHLLDE